MDGHYSIVLVSLGCSHRHCHGLAHLNRKLVLARMVPLMQQHMRRVASDTANDVPVALWACLMQLGFSAQILCPFQMATLIVRTLPSKTRTFAKWSAMVLLHPAPPISPARMAYCSHLSLVSRLHVRVKRATNVACAPNVSQCHMQKCCRKLLMQPLLASACMCPPASSLLAVRTCFKQAMSSTTNCTSM